MIDFIVNNILDIVFTIISIPFIILFYNFIYAIANKKKFSFKSIIEADSKDEQNIKLFLISLVIYWVVLIGGLSLI